MTDEQNAASQQQQTGRGIPYPVRFALFYLFFYGGLNPIVTYMNLYLEKDVHLTGSQIGTYQAVTMFVTMAAIPLIGMLGDRTRRYKSLLIGFTAAAVALAFLLWQQRTFVLVLAVGLLFEMSRNSIVPMADTQIMNYVTRHGSNYGQMKSCGSFGAVVGGVLVGLLADRTGVGGTLFPYYMGVMTAALLLAISFPNGTGRAPAQGRAAVVPGNPAKGSGAASGAPARKKGGLKELLKNRDFLLVLFLSFTCNNLGDTVTGYAGNHLVVTMGAPTSMISVSTFLMCVPEIILLTQLNRRMIPKLGFHRIYIFATIGALLRFAIYFLAPTPQLFLVGSVFHCCYSVVNMAVHVTVLRKVVPSDVFGTAVAALNAVFMFAKAFYGYIFGIIYQYQGSRMIFVLAFCIAAVSCVTAVTTKRFDRLQAG